MDDDFGYTQNVNNDNVNSVNVNDVKEDIENIDTNTIDNVINNELVANINNIDDSNKNDIDKKNKDIENNATTGGNANEPLQAGTSIEIGEEVYTVDNNGNIVDKNGNIFKEAKDVQTWLKTFEQIDNKTEDININTIQEAIGIEITDDNDKPIEYENNPNGIKEYINAVIDSAKEEHFETAINTLYQKYPILNDVLNYYIANGNSLEGFNEIPDRSNIIVDDSNEEQQEAIIRTAWKERNQKGDIDGYIQYLKSSGTLFATAKDELTALQESDKEYRMQLAKEAEERENDNIKQLEKYWNGVHEVIKTRKIAGYQIPESIIINRNNQKLSVTPEDFFNYIYRVDATGKSAYEKDLEAETPESRRDDEILRAYLKFVGGNYSNLVGMAINKEKVNTLKLKAKERNFNTIRINKPKTVDTNNKNIDFGYN